MKKLVLIVAALLIGLSAEAQLVRSSALVVTKEEMPPVELGWKHIVDAQLGTSGYGFCGGLHYIAGYRFSENLLAGVGVGYEHIGNGFPRCFIDSEPNVHFEISDDNESAVPLYLHGRYYFSDNEWAPYVGVSAGLYLAKRVEVIKANYIYTDLEWELGYYDWENAEVVKKLSSSSLYFDLNVGLNHRLTATRDLAFYGGLKLWGEPCYFGAINSLDKRTESSVGVYVGTSVTF
ncbi:MAG: hypothetical protein IKM41_05695 [Tidjanibacter sp.]|nr:hypothetical protein [Tidjanibacter sp.]